ncbi:hypothetical protein ARMGADRAFT_932814 [Armillaria gallica]|uniref:Uncharacterized protein n=1 Tax=Armillaria gallica TaxID=47427 RepID=A0A2H3DUW7_ARMGA|nr:hypothetical protein ARMGADRAFT_932814 [Armillaria gallica]
MSVNVSGDWSCLGFIEDKNVLVIAHLPEVPEEEGNKEWDILMPDGWDIISVKTN